MRYCRLFQYLLRLKRMQLELETTWAALGGHRARAEEGATARRGAPPLPPLWQVRSHMAHFINNLQLYIQVPPPPPPPPGGHAWRAGQSVHLSVDLLRLLPSFHCSL